MIRRRPLAPLLRLGSTGGTPGGPDPDSSSAASFSGTHVPGEDALSPQKLSPAASREGSVTTRSKPSVSAFILY